MISSRHELMTRSTFSYPLVSPSSVVEACLQAISWDRDRPRAHRSKRPKAVAVPIVQLSL